MTTNIPKITVDNDECGGGSELNQILNRRQNMNDSLAQGEEVERVCKSQAYSTNVYVEFTEFTRKEIKALEKKHKE